MARYIARIGYAMLGASQGAIMAAPSGRSGRHIIGHRSPKRFVNVPITSVRFVAPRASIPTMALRFTI